MSTQTRETPPVIALLTDFGREDWFVGTMKGVIKNIEPRAELVDITHDVPRFDIRGGAFALWSAYRYFPRGTIFCSVVDPGVGGERAILCAHDGDYYFVAPDNGLLTLVAGHAGERWRVHRAENNDFFLSDISSTFHGRDIFAPVSAYLARGTALADFGPAVRGHHLFGVPVPTPIPEHSLEGEVLYIDHYGNLITNIQRDHVSRHYQGYERTQDWRMRIGNILIPGLSHSFADKKKGEILFYRGSSEYIEIAINLGNAAELVNAVIGTQVRLFVH